MEKRKKSNYSLGKTGEEIALKHLKKKKYEIVQRNFRFFKGEIDIIALDKKELVFIEVKTRKSKVFGLPEEAVTKQKQQQIRRIAQGFIAKKNIQNTKCRFDVLSVLFTENGKFDINHIKNAF